MDRPALLSRQAERAQDLAQAGHVVAITKTLLDQSGDVLARPSTNAVTLERWATQDKCPQARLLPIGQARVSMLGPIRQPGQAFGIVAHDSVAQCLTLHPGQPGRLGARHAVLQLKVYDGNGNVERLRARLRIVSHGQSGAEASSP
jgi:hypothetical protein